MAAERTHGRTLALVLFTAFNVILAVGANLLGNVVADEISPLWRHDAPPLLAGVVVMYLAVNVGLAHLQDRFSDNWRVWLNPRRRLLWVTLLIFDALLAALGGLLSNLAADRLLPTWLSAYDPVLYGGVILLALFSSWLLYRLENALVSRRTTRQALLDDLRIRYETLRAGALQGRPPLALNLRWKPMPSAQHILPVETDAASMSEYPSDQSSPFPGGALPPPGLLRLDAVISGALGESDEADKHGERIERGEHQAPAREDLALPVAPLSGPAAYFDASGRALVLLGQAGTGKSVWLTDLALELLHRARQDDAEPVPVLFSLSTWAINRKSLHDWLIENLQGPPLRLPAGLAKSWVETGVILPLLDGLDEVGDSSLQQACVNAVIEFRHAHPTIGLALTSRENDYEHLRTRPPFETAVLQLPSRHQVIGYVRQAGPLYAPLAEAIAESDALSDLLQTVLFLQIVLRTYPDVDPQSLPQDNDAAQWVKQLFHDYVARTLRHQRSAGELDQEEFLAYSAEQITTHLSWLAANMRDHNLTELRLNNLDVSWLPTDQARRRYYAAAGAAGGVLGAVLTGIIGGLLSPVAWLVSLWSSNAHNLIVISLLAAVPSLRASSFFSLLTLGVALGMVEGFATGHDFRLDEDKLEEAETWSKHILLLPATCVGLYGCFVGWLVWAYWPFLIAGSPRSRIVDGCLLVSMIALVPLVFVLGFFNAKDDVESHDGIDPQVGSSWLVGSMSKTSRRAFGEKWPRVHWMSMLFCVVALGAGIVSGILYIHYNSLEMIPVQFGFPVLIILRVASQYSLPLNRYILLDQLPRLNLAPRPFEQFLEYAAAKVLLQKVDDGYRFIHPLLRDYFADL